MDVIGFEQSREESDRGANQILDEITKRLENQSFTPVAIILTWDEYALVERKLRNLSQAHYETPDGTRPIYSEWSEWVHSAPAPKNHSDQGFFYGYPIFVKDKPKPSKYIS